MNRDTLTKVCSTTLSLALALTAAPMPAGAFGPVGPAGPSFVAGLTPPAQFGYVASSYAPNNEDKPRLIVIADLHGHLQVQRHIMGILENLIGQLRKSGTASEHKQIPIFVEGGWEPGLEEPLRLIKEPSVRAFMAEYYLQKAEINASQAYSEKVAGTGQVTLIGAETKEEYLANKSRFVKTYPARKELLLALQREEASIQVLEGYVSGSAFKHLQQMRDDYIAGRIQPETYAQALSRAARRNHITGKQVDVLQRARTADPAELEIAFSEVYRSVIHSASAQKPLTSFLRQSLANEDAIRENLARIDASLDLLKRLVGNQLTPDEVPLALARMPELVSVAQLLLENSPLKEKAAEIVRESFDFYPFAMVRDDSLTDNSLKALDHFGSDATGILVAGGFHTDSIVERLRAKHIAYLLIHPSVSRDLSATEQLNYVKRVCDDHVTVAELSQDINALRHGGTGRLAEAALGPVAGLGPQDTSGGKSMLGGVANRSAAELHLVADANVLATLLRSGHAAVEQTAAPAGLKDAVASQLKSVIGERYYASIADQIQWNAGISLDQKLTGDYGDVQGSISKANAQTLANTVNAVLRSVDQGRLKTAEDISGLYFVSVPDDVAIHQLRSYGKIFWTEGDTHRTIVLGETQFGLIKHTLNQLGKVEKGSDEEVALMNALNTFVHELTHAFDVQGKSETSTVLKGIAISAGIVASRFAGEGEARDAVVRFISAITPQLVNSKEGAWVGKALPDLAETIADIIAPRGLTAENVKAVVDLLAKNYPEQTEYTIAQVVASEAASVQGRIELAMGGDGIPPGVVQRAGNKLKKVAADAKGFLISG